MLKILSHRRKSLLLLSVLLIVSFGYYQYIRKKQLATPSPPHLTAPISHIDSILVEKGKRLITFYQNDQPIRIYAIALGFAPVGTKTQEGDGKTPEGKYKIIAKNPNSLFHLSVKISYPAQEDIKQAAQRNVSPGGEIMIHGLGKGFAWLGAKHVLKDWTLGCIAVTNEEIAEVYPFIHIGTPVEIRP